jgi:magnesium chelatase family protein
MALAHGGVLVLDELPEFRRDLLEALREPLETGEIRVARAKRKVVWQARVVLIAACNNCPCGWCGSRRKVCRCGEGRRLTYRQRISGPVLDRIDLHINVPEPDASTADLFVRLNATAGGGPRTPQLLARVEAARSFGAARNGNLGVALNRDLGAQHLVQASGLSTRGFAALVSGIVPRSASSRAVLRCLRVARTIADLAASAEIRPEDLAQAWSWQAERAAQDRGEDPSGLA